MYRALASHNADIRQLVEKGFAVGIDSEYLVVRDLPYLCHDGGLKMAAIVTKLTFIDNVKIDKPDDHQVFFCGSPPHQLDGAAIPNLGGGPTQLALKDPELAVERSFSNKPPEGFSNFFDKIESYVRIICGPAMAKFGASPYTGRCFESADDESVFKFRDSMTSRAEIGDLSRRFSHENIVIIGLGGTGGYLLDYAVKTSVNTIRGYDADRYLVHNAYRSAGKLEVSDLGRNKADVYADRYGNFRKGLTLEPRFIDASSSDAVAGATFAFVCVDKGSSRAGIFDLLISERIPFIDVGMGLNRNRRELAGMARVTYYPPDRAEAMRAMALAEMHDDPDDEYRTNVQIAELNALNASIAMIKYKQVCGFFHDDAEFNHALFGFHNLTLNGATL